MKFLWWLIKKAAKEVGTFFLLPFALIAAIVLFPIVWLSEKYAEYKRSSHGGSGMKIKNVWTGKHSMEQSIVTDFQACDNPEQAYLAGSCTENECQLCSTPSYARQYGMKHAGIPTNPII
jgi:hypothetical protein